MEETQQTEETRSLFDVGHADSRGDYVASGERNPG
jgi:hypothetical protein